MELASFAEIELTQFALVGINFAIPLFCIATMFAIGLNATFEEAFVAPFRNLLALAIVVLVNNVFVPLLGIITLILLSPQDIDGSFSVVSPNFGFLLLMLASGTILGPTFATISGAEKTFAKGIQVILITISVLLLPLMLGLLTLFIIKDDSSIDFTKWYQPLLVYQLLPLVLGMIIKGMYDPIAERIRPLILQLTGLTFLILLALLPLTGFGKIMAMIRGSIALIIVTLIVVVLTMVIGYYGGVVVRNVVKASNQDIPRSLATSTTTRNVTVALILLLYSDIDELNISIAVVLIIYLISLIVSSHQSVQWGKEAAEASQDNGVAETIEAAAS